MAELGEEGQPPQKKKYKVNVQESIDRVLDYIGLDDTPWRAIVVLWNTKTDPLGKVTNYFAGLPLHVEVGVGDLLLQVKDRVRQLLDSPPLAEDAARAAWETTAKKILLLNVSGLRKLYSKICAHLDFPLSDFGRITLPNGQRAKLKEEDYNKDSKFPDGWPSAAKLEQADQKYNLNYGKSYVAPLYSENMKRAPLQVFILAWGVNHPWLIDKLYNDVLLETQDRREIIKSNVSKSSAPSRSSTPHASVVLSSSGPLEIFHILSWSVTAALQSPHAECRRWFIGGVPFTGKTSVARALRDHLQNHGLKPLAVAHHRTDAKALGGEISTRR